VLEQRKKVTKKKKIQRAIAVNELYFYWYWFLKKKYLFVGCVFQRTVL